MAKDPLKIAAGELGVTENPPSSNMVKYNDWYWGRKVSGKDYPWCMAFVQWCFAQAGLRLPHVTASCSDLLSWYRKFQPERVVTAPKPRDIIIFNFGHTGIVESVADSTITTIEGNTSSDDTGSQSNGGGVFRRKRSKSLVTAYIRPFNSYTFEEDDMDQKTFNKMFKTAMDDYRKDLRDNDSGSWSKEAREFAVTSGLFAGSGTAPDGQPNYMWEDLITREQAAQLFYRFAQMKGLA